MFGKFKSMLQNHRDSDQIRLNNCLEDAGADPLFAIKCLDSHIANIRSSNEAMKT